MKEELSAMKKRYNRKASHYVPICAPQWITPRDPLWRVFDEKNALLREGKIALAYIVQANVKLFKFSAHGDHPASIVYSTDPLVAEHPHILSSMAMKLYAYKNRPLETVPEEYQAIAKCITSERDRSSFVIKTEYNGQPVKIHFAPIIIFRKLIPWGKLSGDFLPVLTSPECKSVLVLPKKYWSGRFKRLWCLRRI